MDIVIKRLYELPSDIDAGFLEAALDEKFFPIQWLIDDWRAGKNRFSLLGEAFYEARIQGRLVGVCGMNQDPYVDIQVMVGRIRRLYVLPEYRRIGVGKQLVFGAVTDAHQHFAEINLRTFDHDSARFFEGIGSIREYGDDRRTHRMEIQD